MITLSHPMCPKCGHTLNQPRVEEHGTHGVHCPVCGEFYDCVTEVTRRYTTTRRDTEVDES